MYEPRICRKCGKEVAYIRAPSGFVRCNGKMVHVIADKKDGKLYYLGQGKTLWGRKVDNQPGAIPAWEPHNGECPPVIRGRRKRLTAEELATERKRAEEQRERVESALLAKREKEWAALAGKEWKHGI